MASRDIICFEEYLTRYHNISCPQFRNVLDLVYIKVPGTIPHHIYEFNTRVPWDDFAKVVEIFCQNHKISEPKIATNLIFSLPQLINLKFMEELYYMLGHILFKFVFLECTVYIKWGSKCFVLLSDFKNSLVPIVFKKPYLEFYQDVLILQGNGFDSNLPLKIHKMFFNSSLLARHLLLIPFSNMDEIVGSLANVDVGQVIFTSDLLSGKDTKFFRQILRKNPTFAECEVILNSLHDIEENLVSTSTVISFVTEIINKYVPHNIFGPKKYLIRFKENVAQILKLNRYQKVTLKFLTKGVIRDIQMWRKNLKAKLILWIFQIFVMRLIQNFFYVSETEKGPYLVFVKKEFWLNYSREAIQSMIENKQLIRVKSDRPKDELKHLRFLPKLNGSGYRPLIRKSLYDAKMEDKYALCNTFLKQLIALRSGRYPLLVADIGDAWINFLNKSDKKRKTYFVKSDIMDAYGSIVHDKLKSILNIWMENLPEELLLYYFSYRGRWGKTESMSQFVDLPPAIGRKILTYQSGRDKMISLSELKMTIFSFIDNIYLKAYNKRQIYKLVKGLHQGGKLSSSLCEIYCTSLDMHYLRSFCQDGDIFSRAVDDYLFISQNAASVKKFLEVLVKGFSDYGIKIQLHKTQVNFENNFDVETVESSLIPYFGYIFDLKKGYILPNMKNYENSIISSSLSFRNLNKYALEAKMTNVCSLKLQKLLLDPNYQSKRVLIRNIHTAACVLALRFSGMIKYFRMAEIHIEENFLMECVKKALSRLASACSMKAKPKLYYRLILKLCIRSFKLILKRKKCFTLIVMALQKMERTICVKSARSVKIIKAVSKEIHPCLLKSVKYA